MLCSRTGGKGVGQMKENNTIFGGTLLLTAGNLLLRLISIGLNVFLADHIGAAGLGLLQLISTVGGFALLAGTCGIRVGAMCLAAEEFGHQRPGGVRLAMETCLRWGLGLSVTVGGLLFLLAGPIATRLLFDARATLSLRVMAVFLPASVLSGIMTGYLTASAKIRHLVAIKLAEQLLSAGLTVALLVFWADGSLTRACAAIVFGTGAATILDFSLLYAVYRRDLGKTASEGAVARMRARLGRLAVPLALNDILRAGLTTAEQLLIPFGLAHFTGSGAEAMADYGTIHALVFPVLMFPAAILFAVADLLVPELSRSRAMGRQLRIRDLTDKCLRLTLLFACAVAGVFFLGAEGLTRLVYGSAAAAGKLRLFAPMVLMLYTDAITDGMLKGLAEQVSCVRYNTFTSVLDVLFLWWLLPRWGIGGYVFTFALTHGINLFLSLRRLLQVTGHRPCLRDFALPLGCAAVAGCVVSVLPADGLGRAACYLLLLAGLFLLTQALSDGDFRWLRRVVKQK